MEDPMSCHMSCHWSIPLSLAVVVAAATFESAGQDGDQTDQARNCVDVMRIDRTEVVDDDTVLFYMRTGDVYRNELRNSCPTLGFEERFMYRTALSQLCDIDVITVIRDVGFGFLPTASCGLGKFEPITESTADELIRTAEQRSSQQDGDRR